MPVEEKSLLLPRDVDVTLEQRARAIRAVASAAADATDCRLLLDMLGLNPHEHTPPAPEPRAER